MKRERLHLSQHQCIETGRDLNGRFWVGYSSGVSRFFRDAKALRRFLQLTPGLPSRASFDSWIASLAAADAERQSHTANGLSSEHVATGFGPECHALDESDPNHNTKMVI